MDLLSDILSQLHLNGTLYFRTSFTSPWSVKVPEFEKVSRFHFAHKGRCLVRVNEHKDPVLLDQGDLIIITRGASHTLFCDPKTEGQALHLDQVVALSGFKGKGTLVYGEPGTHHETQLICGHFSFHPHASHPLIDNLPDYIHIPSYGSDAGNWMESTLRIIGTEAGQNNLGSELIALKMSEIIYAQALRSFLNSKLAEEMGLAGFTDPAIARALTAIHSQPDAKWTLENLSTIAGISRTLLAARFTRCLFTTPMGYVTEWRMQLARKKLLDSDTPIIQIAEQVGYQSEAAFGRVFKKYFKIAPATFRRQNKIDLLSV